MQLKFNGKSKEGHAITNGELVTVRRVHVDGSLTIECDRQTIKTLSPQQRLFSRGYAVMSHASQGKIVDTVLLAMRPFPPRVIKAAAKVSNWCSRSPTMKSDRFASHQTRAFGGYAFDARVDGFVASPEKALFDPAYLTAMNRSRVSGSLPETNLQGLRWKEVQAWRRRIPTPRVRAAVGRALRAIREQHAGVKN